jgi:hypothetical protein
MNTFQSDQHFSSTREFVDFFIRNPLFQTKELKDADKLGRAGFIFRGQSNSEWPLIPSAFRPGLLTKFTGRNLESDFPVHEAELRLKLHLHTEALAIFRFVSCADNIGISTPLDYGAIFEEFDRVLSIDTGVQAALDKNHLDFPRPSIERAAALAQHSGVPTRFLDWSESPLVACYFAAMSASSFASSPPPRDQKISVIYVLTSSTSAANGALRVIRSPRWENANLKEQRGVFTSAKRANQFFIKNLRWPTLHESCGDKDIFCRATLPASCANHLLKELFDLGLTRHSLMPTLENAASSYQYAKTLFS